MCGMTCALETPHSLGSSLLSTQRFEALSIPRVKDL